MREGNMIYTAFIVIALELLVAGIIAGVIYGVSHS